MFLADHEQQAEREWACLSVLAEHAPGLAPVPLRRTAKDGSPVVVMERLPGSPLGGAPLSHDQTNALGRTLRRLYTVPLDTVRAAGISERRGGPTRLPNALREWLADDHDLGPCRDPSAVALALRAVQEWLEATTLPEPHLTVLGIGDLNPANVLWDGGTMRLVDFEDGGVSDPAYELADHVEHIASRLPGIYDPDALARAVGLDGVQRARMAAYRPLWAAFWLAMLVPGSGGWHRNPPGTLEAQAAHFMALVADL